MAKEQPELLLQVIEATGAVSDHLYGYVQTGDLTALNKAANALMVMASLQTRGQFGKMLSQIVRSEHVLTEEQREQAKEVLKQNGNA